MAGVRFVEEVLTTDANAFDITIFGSEPHVNYNRILLSTVLQGNTKVEDIILNSVEWYQKNSITLYSSETVIHIDTVKKQIKTDKKRSLPYDKLVIATGSTPFMLPIPGSNKEGVIAFRTIEDCQKMIDTSKSYKKAVVIGGGLLGLEAARGLLNLKMEVDVVHIESYLMDRQLDQTASKMLQAELEKQGMNFLLQKMTAEIVGDGRVEGLRFKDGTETSADLVVMAVGVRPNVQLAKESGIETNRAIVVNDFLETSIEDVYAVGECVEHRETVYGLVKPLYEQGKVLASHICKKKTEGYQGSVLSTQLKISGVNVFSAGQIVEDETTKSVKVFDEIEQVYKKVVCRNDVIVGSVMFGDTSDGPRMLDMIIKQKDISDLENVQLLQTASLTEAPVQTMASTDIICQCNGVSKRRIIDAVQNEGCSSVDEIKKCTRASGSCGSCKPLVANLLDYIQSDTFDEVVEEIPLCSCVNVTEETLIEEILTKNVTSRQEVMRALGREHEQGCPICIPAIDYYLAKIHPTPEKVNERIHAKKNHDGTFSIEPQMYAGQSSAQQLRVISEVVEKYSIPQVMITSSQRISLSGIKAEQLEEVYQDLNMALYRLDDHFVYSIQTCAGQRCTCDKSESILLAMKLEQSVEQLKTPQEVKIGVSACLHNGAHSTTKDIGLIRMDRGWEIYAGGSSRREPRAGELLCIAETVTEAIEITRALFQYYRETAKYLEYISEWLDRVGVIHVREVLFDFDLREQLVQQMEEDQANTKSVFTL
nr:nitrite reductase large subunit NirB [Bacillus alkalicellulosilyticus]